MVLVVCTLQRQTPSSFSTSLPARHHLLPKMYYTYSSSPVRQCAQTPEHSQQTHTHTPRRVHIRFIGRGHPCVGAQHGGGTNARARSVLFIQLREIYSASNVFFIKSFRRQFATVATHKYVECLCVRQQASACAYAEASATCKHIAARCVRFLPARCARTHRQCDACTKSRAVQPRLFVCARIALVPLCLIVFEGVRFAEGRVLEDNGCFGGGLWCRGLRVNSSRMKYVHPLHFSEHTNTHTDTDRELLAHIDHTRASATII